MDGLYEKQTPTASRVRAAPLLEDVLAGDTASECSDDDGQQRIQAKPILVFAAPVAKTARASKPIAAMHNNLVMSQLDPETQRMVSDLEGWAHVLSP